MKTKSFFSFFVLFFLNFSVFAVDLQVQAQQHAKVKFLICTVGKKTAKLEALANRIQKDFLFTNQFAVSCRNISTLKNKSNVKKFYNEGFPLVLFLKKGNGRKAIEWRLYDTQDASMLVGKNYIKRGKKLDEWGHHIADAVWPTLTGQEGFFSTKVAYCKEVRKPGKKLLKHVYIADFDGSNEKLLVSTSTINVAPRWNRDPDKPLLFYSEHTNKNVRLVMVNMKGHRKVVANFDGINMLPAFSPDGKQVVFCASRGGGSCQLYLYQKGILKKLTDNSGNNISPTFSDDSKSLFYCCDVRNRCPQIYKYNFETGKSERLTSSGYCVSPSFCAKKNQLAYAKMVRGTMQLFLHDLSTKKDKQLTFDVGNKEECSWSSCGNYLLFAVETRKESRLAMLNLNSNERKFITAGNSVCCYPAWSSPYSNFSAG